MREGVAQVLTSQSRFCDRRRPETSCEQRETFQTGCFASFWFFPPGRQTETGHGKKTASCVLQARTSWMCWGRNGPRGRLHTPERCESGFYWRTFFSPARRARASPAVS